MKHKLVLLMFVVLGLILMACGKDKGTATLDPTDEKIEETISEKKAKAWDKAKTWVEAYYGEDIATDSYADSKVEKAEDGYIITMKVYLDGTDGKVNARTVTLISNQEYEVTDTRNLEKTTEEVLAQKEKEEQEAKAKEEQQAKEKEEQEKQKAEVEKAKAEAEKAKEEAAKAKADAEKAKKEKAQAEAEKKQKVEVTNNYFITTPRQCYDYYWDYEYVIYDSDCRYLSYNELTYYTLEELRLARNEIYARHGRLFDSKDLQAYFWNKSWYYGCVSPDDFKASVFNKYESANIKMIKKVEKAKK